MLFERRDDKDTVPPDKRRCVSFAGDGNFPYNVLCPTPSYGYVLFQAGAIAARSSPSGPVFGQDGTRQGGDERYRQTQAGSNVSIADFVGFTNQ